MVRFQIRNGSYLGGRGANVVMMASILMDPSFSGTVRPIGHALVAAAVLGKSLGTLLGPTSCTKCVYQEPNPGAVDC